jgi:hypothetical protein
MQRWSFDVFPSCGIAEVKLLMFADGVSCSDVRDRDKPGSDNSVTLNKIIIDVSLDKDM